MASARQVLPIVAFYDPDDPATDHAGRTLNQILEYSDDELETRHDYIQVLFPLPEPSGFSSTAPVIDEDTFKAFRRGERSAILRSEVRRSLLRMLRFYGIEFEEARHTEQLWMHVPQVFPPQTRRTLIKPCDHNHLRMTRMIRSLRVLGLRDEAVGLYSVMQDLCRKFNFININATSQDMWRRAATRKLHLAPHVADDVDEADCEMWLQEYDDGEESPIFNFSP